MSETTYNIGSIIVCKKGTTNPYWHPYWSKGRENTQIEGHQGKDRLEAFRKLYKGISQPKVEFWYAPCNGGAFKLTNPKAQIEGLEFWVARIKS